MESLRPGQRVLLESLAWLASTEGTALYLVGGAVRDACARRTPKHLDVAIEGVDPGQVARRIAATWLDRVVQVQTWPDTRTARLDVPGLGHLDLVGCRKEFYPTPGARPVTEAGSLLDDLRRRDFTVNAIALRLDWPLEASQLQDPFGGRADLAWKCLRSVHSGSYREDPARVIRAARLASRLGLSLAAGELAAAAEGDLQLLADPRYSAHWQAIFSEFQPGDVFLQLRRWALRLPWPFAVSRVGPLLRADARRLVYGVSRTVYLALWVRCQPARLAEQQLRAWGIPQAAVRLASQEVPRFYRGQERDFWHCLNPGRAAPC